MAIDIWIISKKAVFIDYTNISNNILRECIGSIEEDDVIFAQRITNLQDIKLFNYIIYYDNTVFNPKQIRQLKKEIEYLKNVPDINQNMLDTIYKGINNALQSPNLYLMFEYE